MIILTNGKKTLRNSTSTMPVSIWWHKNEQKKFKTGRCRSVGQPSVAYAPNSVKGLPGKI
jgi:hypothetical protein